MQAAGDAFLGWPRLTGLDGQPRDYYRVAIAAYLGKGDAFDRALADFSAAYADQNEGDYEAFLKAVKAGRLSAESGL